MLPAVVATDNVGVTEIKTSIPNGTEVEWGEYEVTYTASDKAKNTASCSFDITIAGKNMHLKMFFQHVVEDHDDG